MVKIGRYNDKNVMMNYREYVYVLKGESLTLFY